MRSLSQAWCVHLFLLKQFWVQYTAQYDTMYTLGLILPKQLKPTNGNWKLLFAVA